MLEDERLKESRAAGLEGARKACHRSRIRVRMLATPPKVLPAKRTRTFSYMPRPALFDVQEEAARAAAARSLPQLTAPPPDLPPMSSGRVVLVTAACLLAPRPCALAPAIGEHTTAPLHIP